MKARLDLINQPPSGGCVLKRKHEDETGRIEPPSRLRAAVC